LTFPFLLDVPLRGMKDLIPRPSTRRTAAAMHAPTPGSPDKKDQPERGYNAANCHKQVLGLLSPTEAADTSISDVVILVRVPEPVMTISRHRTISASASAQHEVRPMSL
jgi:hypothetical protein